ncbi:hypothetical protein LTR56_001684 [Elasticomyces elasticus]|nr:hypothetical protein LTR56_001684 [Elasticomyces elasticus]KAK3667265.1 hypothetical protein LTR22_001781 [Elasticomyces elasticus]KAK4932657.1 hypothetical protein LTR49_001081 [Elasticomyces elasticus]KAK5769678.1 hypothetical protein LTS12_000128 [Elasticomyces elasticus]
MSTFQLPSSTVTTSTAYSSDEEDTLPYPGELSRSDFLSPDFNPEAYLSSLGRNRHQTLEDLRSDLRSRSQLLNQELLELVNGNYEEFLSLGADLHGGEERVEGVKVGVMGFGREVGGVGKVVREREVEMGVLLNEKKGIGGEVGVGRALLEVDARLGEMEESLGITDRDDDEEEEFGDDDDFEDGDGSGLSPGLRRLQRHTREFILLTRMVERIGSSHPFLVAHQSRVEAIRKTLLLDLAAALRQAKTAKEADAMLGIVRMFSDLGAEGEGVRVLRGS